MSNRIEAPSHNQQRETSDQAFADASRQLSGGISGLVDFGNAFVNLNVGVSLKEAEITHDSITFLGGAGTSAVNAVTGGARDVGHVVANGARATGHAISAEVHNAHVSIHNYDHTLANGLEQLPEVTGALNATGHAAMSVVRAPGAMLNQAQQNERAYEQTRPAAAKAFPILGYALGGLPQSSESAAAAASHTAGAQARAEVPAARHTAGAPARNETAVQATIPGQRNPGGLNVAKGDSYWSEARKVEGAHASNQAVQQMMVKLEKVNKGQMLQANHNINQA
jgi:hypothetical protein